MPKRIIREINERMQNTAEVKKLFGRRGVFSHVVVECKKLTHNMENKSDLSEKPLNTLTRFAQAVFEFKLAHLDAISKMAQITKDKRKRKEMLNLVRYLSHIPQHKNLFFDPKAEHHDDAIKILYDKHKDKLMSLGELKSAVQDIKDAQYAYAHNRHHHLPETEIDVMISTYRPLVNQTRKVMIEITSKLAEFHKALA